MTNTEIIFLDDNNNNKKFNSLDYKIKTRNNWNSVAAIYHFEWAKEKIGPFQSTNEVIKISTIKNNDKILDIACGTGAVLKEISKLLGEKGLLIGIDIANKPLQIAKSEIDYSNIMLLEMDVENLEFRIKFDKIYCQYALMFFPNVHAVVKKINSLLERKGEFIFVVHGNEKQVPYFSSIMKNILKYIPDIRPTGSPTVHGLGDPDKIYKLIQKSGMNLQILKKIKYYYDAENFEEYWNDYLSSTAYSIRKIIESKNRNIIEKIKEESRESCKKYITHGRLIFPWEVYICVATKT